MNDQTLNMIQALATKLGTTTEYLWHVLVHAQIIGGIEDVIYAFIWLILAIGCGGTIYSIASKRIDWIDFGDAQFAYVILGFAMLPVSVIFLIEMSQGIDALLRPEYFALKEILRKVN
jgi:hypothetical protein